MNKKRKNTEKEEEVRGNAGGNLLCFLRSCVDKHLNLLGAVMILRLTR